MNYNHLYIDLMKKKHIEIDIEKIKKNKYK